MQKQKGKTEIGRLQQMSSPGLTQLHRTDTESTVEKIFIAYVVNCADQVKYKTEKI